MERRSDRFNTVARGGIPSARMPSANALPSRNVISRNPNIIRQSSIQQHSQQNVVNKSSTPPASGGCGCSRKKQ